eukprot:8553771-Karenia_brevis.AAC.1
MAMLPISFAHCLRLYVFGVIFAVRPGWLVALRLFLAALYGYSAWVLGHWLPAFWDEQHHAFM